MSQLGHFQTLARPRTMSASGHRRAQASSPKSANNGSRGWSFDQLVSAKRDAGRDFNPHRLCRLKIDDEFKFRRLLNRNERAIFDGEVVIVHEGRTNFSELQADLASGKQRRMVFYAFDLLFLEGFDLRKSPQFERKRLLKMLFDETKLQSPILYSEHMLTDGNEMFAASCKLGFEGIISKNAEAPYRSDRNEG